MTQTMERRWQDEDTPTCGRCGCTLTQPVYLHCDECATAYGLPLTIAERIETDREIDEAQREADSGATPFGLVYDYGGGPRRIRDLPAAKIDSMLVARFTRSTQRIESEMKRGGGADLAARHDLACRLLAAAVTRDAAHRAAEGLPPSRAPGIEHIERDHRRARQGRAAR